MKSTIEEVKHLHYRVVRNENNESDESDESDKSDEIVKTQDDIKHIKVHLDSKTRMTVGGKTGHISKSVRFDV